MSEYGATNSNGRFNDRAVCHAKQNVDKRDLSSSPMNRNYNDDTYLTELVPVPPRNDYAFSWKRLWSFTGPGFLMSIAFLDPGNIESDLQSGVKTGYQLLWVLLLSTVLALMVQILAARLGTVTGLHLAELCYSRYPRIPRLILWVMTETAIICSDMQEVIGTAVSLYLLSQGYIPIWAGVLITVLDTFAFLFLDKYGLRKLEAFFATLITVMALTFGYEFIRMGPSGKGIAEGLVNPTRCDNCKDGLLQAVGIVGAIIMPHNLFLHSALVKSRDIDRKSYPEVKDANRYYLIESAIALFVSLLINISVTAVFADGIFNVPMANIAAMCEASPIEMLHGQFTNTTEPDDVDLYKAGIYLGCTFGMAPLIIWAIGLYAAGQSSTMTGTYAGQFCMEGFLNLEWPRWKRVLVTRTIAIIPTVAVAAGTDLSSLNKMNIWINAILTIQLPWALLPTLTFSSSARVMGKFKNSALLTTASCVVATAVIIINVYFVQSQIDTSIGWVMALLVIFYLLYISFILYLVGCFLVVLGCEPLTRLPTIGPYLCEPDNIEFHHSDSPLNLSDSRNDLVDELAATRNHRPQEPTVIRNSAFEDFNFPTSAAISHDDLNVTTGMSHDNGPKV